MGIVTTALRRGAVASVAAASLVVSGLVAGVGAAPAAAASDPTLPITVSADALPTVQIDGVVWRQLVVGNTVYVAGKFSFARPAGSAAGTNQTARNNMLAYDLTTGALITSFAPSFNAQVKDLAVSADGRTLYAGGSFTTVNGQTRNRVAALDIPSGTLKSWAPSVNAAVQGLAVHGSKVYLGGVFTTVGGQARPRVAAVDASSGAVQPFVAAVDDNQVNAVVVAPDGLSVVIAGNFTTVGGASSPGYGLARLDAASGASLPLPVNSEIRNGGPSSAIGSLSTNGTYFYGTGWHYGDGGNSEGTFAASWATGELVWLEDCHGDTYSAAPVGDVVYLASHKHYCGNSGGFPQNEPWTFQHGTAVTNDVRGTNTADIYGYEDHPGTPRPEFLEWYPTFTPGNATGANQGPWTVAGNSSYVLFGGEFMGVNGKAQQGLVRFANRSIAPKKVGPANKGPFFGLSVLSYRSGQVRLSWPGNPDKDDDTVVYDVYRQSTATAPIYSRTISAPFWKQPRTTFTDTTQAPGSAQRYKVVATDPDGNRAESDWMNVTVSSEELSPYAQGVLDDAATSFWRLGEASGTTAFDWAGTDDLTTGAGVTRGAAGAIDGDPNTASTFSGTSTGSGATATPVAAPNTFTAEAWIKTTTTSGGKIIGFASSRTGNSGSYDRHVYMANNGRIVFGAYTGQTRTVTSTTSYNDGAWHHVVATLGANGMQLYVDGKRVAQRGDTTSGQDYQGYWRVGGDNLGGWPSQPTSAYFSGAIDDVAVYPSVLSTQQIREHYTDSGRTVDLPPAPADAYGKAVYDAEPDLYWRFNESSGSTVNDAGPGGNGGTLTGSFTRQSTGALTGVAGNRSVTFGSAGGHAYSTAAFTNPAGYTLEGWFSTTSTRGGKVVGFGGSQTGESGSYDRHVYMEDDGQLVFGTWTGVTNTVTTPASYNDGSWHHVMATQGADGMALYLDGQLVGTNPATGAQDYAGYWRVGGDTTWGSTSPYLAGRYDEFAVYSRALSANDALLHHGLGSDGVAPNLPPTSTFTAQVAGRSLTVDGAASADSDGSVQDYAWDFGDGATATTPTAQHAYPRAGTYVVTLTVTDDGGATGVSQQSVTVVNAPPSAAFMVTGQQFLEVTLDGSASSDPDGDLVDATWDFGDGTTGTGTTTQHTFAAGGTYPVTLSVTDDDGATRSVTHDVVVAPNKAPVAAFTSTVSALTVQVDGTSSSDPDGAVASYAWTFGDAGTATTPTAVHTFDAPGTYPVTLTVTDPQGLQDSVTRSVTVTTNEAPVAVITPTVADLSINVASAGSADPDGSIVAYLWEFGDGATATTASAQHTYAAPGTYPVTLTVTDNLGATGTSSVPVEVTAPVVFATDYFSRTAATGWGTADVGGAWTLSGAASQYRVAGGVGVASLNTAGVAPRGQLRTVSAADIDVTAQVSLDKLGNGGGTYVSLTSRASGWGSLYREKIWVRSVGTVALSLTRQTTTEAVLAQVNVPGLTLTPGAVLRTRFQTQGSNPTTLRARVWLDGTAEPTTWQVTSTDSTAELQDAGAIGIDTSLSGSATNAPVVISLDNLYAGRIGAAGPANQAPQAAFTAAATDLQVSVDGSASHDPDGAIASYAWDFDGVAKTGSTASHTFAATGTYPVRLTVTDNQGATATVTQQVSVTAPPAANQLPVAAFTQTTTDLTVAVDGSSSSDPDGSVVSYAWDFAGTPATGVTAAHTFPDTGTYPVTLTVTDDRGGTATTTQQISVVAPPLPGEVVLAEDTFARTLATGWGTATTGGAWTLYGGASQYGVNPGVGLFRLNAAGALPRVQLQGVSATDIDMSSRFSLDKLGSGGGTFYSLTGRTAGWGSMYRGKVWVKSTGVVNLALTRIAGGTEATLAQVNLADPTLVAGDVLNARLQAVGSNPTTLRLRVWKDGTTEPTTWQVSATDSTAELQDAGGVGIDTNLSGSATNAPLAIQVQKFKVIVPVP
ncbi:LamG domain-containing protein [Cellulomonas fengjieae]|uniref:PKD domain-containing protein n=1 Tax=Cellulomonas fengjieae TaxID=2819978 RepID=A0ABS3SNM7_9CELL|nr:LamG domain-containing protein [Cellulomonas fengjieae]MBO3086541.1 PKD domain-containing protein [Cellulomonas fengjieae]QVI66602.1 PKD domain-containing protein [Cellulomonas fengjieae]